MARILKNPNPALREQNTPIKPGAHAKAVARKLTAAMEVADGLGVAAPQIGINERICVVSVDEDTHILCNPEITWHGPDMTDGLEGCLSIPKTYCRVYRYDSIVVKYQDVDGVNCQMSASGLLARVIQHEVDHLNGVLMTDRSLVVNTTDQ